MEEELRNLIKIWISAFISISYCYYISSKISKGFLRLLSVLPVCSLFLVLPLFLSSIHFCGVSALFLSWLATFKLLLFAFDQGPLCSPLASNLFRFFSFACFPIKTRPNPSSNKTPNLHNHKESTPKWVLAFKVFLVGVLLKLYDYSDDWPQFAILALYCLHIYLELELVLVLVAALVSTLLSSEIEPVFNEPYLATSLQDFWSRRWNLMVSAILRATVHIPVQHYSTRFLGPKKAMLAGVLASFIVSGLMHELVYFYVTRKSPTWEVTCFFVLHGIATAAEIKMKRMVKIRLNRMVSGFAVLAFVSLTGVWLFLPQLLRNNVHEKAISECNFVIHYVKTQVIHMFMKI